MQGCLRVRKGKGGRPRARPDSSRAGAIGGYDPAGQMVAVTPGLKVARKAAAGRAAPVARAPLTPPPVLSPDSQEEDTINTAELQTKLKDIPVPVSLEQERIQRDMAYVQTAEYLQTPPPVCFLTT